MRPIYKAITAFYIIAGVSNTQHWETE